MGYDKDRLKFQVGIELSQIKADLPKKAESNLIRLKYDLASYQLAKKTEEYFKPFMLLLWMLPTSGVFLFTLVFYHKLTEDIFQCKRNSNSFPQVFKSIINHNP